MAHQLTPSQQRLFNREAAKVLKASLRPEPRKSYCCLGIMIKCSGCERHLTVQGCNSFEPETVMWTNHDYKTPWNDIQLHYCTKACALSARKDY